MYVEDIWKIMWMCVREEMFKNEWAMIGMDNFMD